MKLHFGLLLLCLLLSGAHAAKLCTTQEGYTFEGGLIKKIDISKDSCGEARCKYECRSDDRCKKWSLMSYSRFGGTKYCYLLKSSAEFKKKEAPNVSYYAGVCKGSA